jgi:hypothetical protein
VYNLKNIGKGTLDRAIAKFKDLCLNIKKETVKISIAWFIIGSMVLLSFYFLIKAIIVTIGFIGLFKVAFIILIVFLVLWAFVVITEYYD